jgi:hypothetical protein
MARSHFWQYIVNEEGQPVEAASISIYEAGTSTAAYVYTQNSGGSPTNTLPQATSNSEGLFEFWIANTSESQGYPSDQRFKVAWSKPGYVTAGEIDNIEIAAYPEEVDELDPVSTTKNKLVSNALAYKWDNLVSVTQIPVGWDVWSYTPDPPGIGDPTRPAGPMMTYTYSFATSAGDVWGVEHKFSNRFVNVQCIDALTNTSIDPTTYSISFDSAATSANGGYLTITHSAPTSGYAVISGAENYEWYYDVYHALGSKWVLVQVWNYDTQELMPCVAEVGYDGPSRSVNYTRVWIQNFRRSIWPLPTFNAMICFYR